MHDENNTPQRLQNWKLLNFLRDTPFLKLEVKGFALLLALHRNASTLDCSPSIARLELETGRGKRQLLRFVSQLEEEKYIIAVKRPDTGRNQYYFLFDFDEALKISKEDGAQCEKGLILKANRKRFALTPRKNKRIATKVTSVTPEQRK